MGRKLLGVLLATVAVVPSGFQASAQEADDAGGVSSEIIVTARKRQESILKVPVVQNVLSAETLEKAQIVDLQGVSSKVPGLYVAPAINTVGTLVSIRGVGTSALDVGIDQSVSLNIDGQQFSQGLTFKSGLFDLAQAEILKGPQALFFGKNSPGGVIVLRTADPNSYAEVIGRVSYEFEAREPRAELILSGPVSDTLRLRLAGSWSDREGFFRNVAGSSAVPALGGLPPKRSRNDSNENWIVRGTALWEPSNSFRARLKVNVTRDDSDSPLGLQLHSCPQGIGPGVFPIDFIGNDDCVVDRETAIVDIDPSAFPGIPNGGRTFLDIKQQFGVLELDFDIAPDISINSTTSYYRNETDGMNSGTYPGGASALYADNDFYRRDITQEIRVQSDYADRPLNWMVGGFYQDGKIKNDLVIGWNQTLNPIISPVLGFGLPPVLDFGTHDVDIESKSLFGQLRWKPAEVLEIAAGVRWTDEKRGNKPTRFGAPVPIPKPTIASKNWSPELTVSYFPNDDLTIFGALKQGYKSGSYQMLTTNPANEDRSFGDEKVQGGEIGLKSRVFDRTMNINAAFYYYRFEGLQVGVSQPAGGAGGIPITRTINAGKSRTYGIDFDASYRPPQFEGLSLNLAVNWNKAKFLKLDGLPCYGGQTIAAGCNQVLNPATGLFTARSASGTPLERAPEWQAVGGFDYEAPLSDAITFALGSSVQHASSYTAPIGDLAAYRQRAQTKLDAYMTVKDADERWEVSLIGNNLNNSIRGGYCANSDFQNITVLTALAQTTGGVSNAGPLNPAGRVDEVACMPSLGRQVTLRLTLRPVGWFK